MLHQLGYSVEHAADGLEAVALVSHRMLQAQGYSLLLMVHILSLCSLPLIERVHAHVHVSMRVHVRVRV